MTETLPESEVSKPKSSEAGEAAKPAFSIQRLAVMTVLLPGWCCFVATVMASLSGVTHAIFSSGGGASGGWHSGGWSSGGWALDLLTHFRVPYATVLMMAVVVSVWIKRWRQAGLLNLALVVNLYLLAPLWTEHQPKPEWLGSPDAVTLKLVQINVLTSNTAYADTSAYLASTGADVLVVQEVNAAWLNQLGAGLPGYGLAARAPRSDNFGMAVWVRDDALPVLAGPSVVAARVLASEATGDVPQIELTVEKDGQRFDLLAVHTLPPVSPGYDAVRRLQIASISDWVSNLPAASADRLVVIGDLNATAWSSPFKQLIQQTGLRDSVLGFGHQGSFPTRAPAPLRIGIDHVLVGPGLYVTARSLGPDLGSDHLPVVVELTAGPPEAPGAPGTPGTPGSPGTPGPAAP